MTLDDMQVPRQQVLRGAGLIVAAGALAACSKTESKTSEKTDETATASGTSDTESSAAAAPDGGVITKTADVAVGSGVIVGETVVTQPTAGDFKGFSAKCTHAGCTLNKVADGTIDCPCHGSKFNLDGSVAHGPATKPLESKAISVKGDSIVEG